MLNDNNERLTQWWNGLSAEEQAEAREAQRTGQFTPALWSSLQMTGVVAPPVAQDKPQKVPRDLRDFLKMRH